MASTTAIIVFFIVINSLALAEKKQDYKFGLLIPYTTVRPHLANDFNKGESFAAAMTIAVERINADPSLLVNYNMTFGWKDTKCNELIALREQLNQINSGVQAFIGPGCNCHTAARNAAKFNMTMISFMCSAAELSNKIKYPTFGRTFPVDSQVGPSLISLLKYTYNWTIVAVVCQNSPKWTSLKEHLLEEFENNGIFVSREYIVTNPASYSNNRKYSEEFSEALRDMKQKARIVVVIGDWTVGLETLYLAKQEGMINGEFVFIIFELNQGLVRIRQERPFLWFYNYFLKQHRNSTVTSAATKEAMQAALILAVKNPRGESYRSFVTEIRLKTSQSPFYSQHYNQSTLAWSTTPPIYAAYLYDAVYQFGVALNKSIAKLGPEAQNRTPSGEEIFSHLHDYSFDSIQGYKTHLDKNGDAQFNLTLLDIRPTRSGHVLIEVGDFQIIHGNPSNSTFGSNEGIPRLVFRKNMAKIWVGGSLKAPKDRPRCGFNNELCPPPSEKPSGISSSSKRLEGCSLYFTASFIFSWIFVWSGVKMLEVFE